MGKVKYEREQGTQMLTTGSVIYWDTRTRRKSAEKNNRTRPCVKVRCGKCEKLRWIQVHNVRRLLRESTFTGYCSECYRALTWEERGRSRPAERKILPNGYIKVYLDRNHPFHEMTDKRGEVYQHRLVMAEALGRPLKSYEHVHHKDGNRSNNELANLEIIDQGRHNIITQLKTENEYLKSLLRQANIDF